MPKHLELLLMVSHCVDLKLLPLKRKPKILKKKKNQLRIVLLMTGVFKVVGQIIQAQYCEWPLGGKCIISSTAVMCKLLLLFNVDYDILYVSYT